jgi:cytochrome c2
MARFVSIFSILAIMVIPVLASETNSGNSSAGQQLVQDLNCTTCHALAGKGAGMAPDLGRAVARNYSPAYVAGKIWSHAPAIWSRLRGQGISSPKLTEEQVAALFAYFASARYFEELGNAKRGSAVFRGMQCEECHPTGAAHGTKDMSVSTWRALDDPIALASILLKRPDAMNKAVAGKRSSPPRLTSQEVTDLLVYLRHQPETRGRNIQYSLSSSIEEGRALFESRGCARCHTGKLSLDQRRSRLTTSGFIAAMWNHNARVKEAKMQLTGENLSAISGYLWSIGLYDERGDAGRGRRLYAKLHCTACHDGSGAAPALNAIRRMESWPSCVDITAGIWNHGPAMMERMRGEGIAWPQFAGSQMADLAAFLRQRSAAVEPAH